MSLSARRAWIEIDLQGQVKQRDTESLSARRAWIEIARCCQRWLPQRSLSARRAWIEITGTFQRRPRSGVALRKESVDRNILPTQSATTYGPSLSARRAWIEILRWYRRSGC